MITKHAHKSSRDTVLAGERESKRFQKNATENSSRMMCHMNPTHASTLAIKTV